MRRVFIEYHADRMCISFDSEVVLAGTFEEFQQLTLDLMQAVVTLSRGHYVQDATPDYGHLRDLDG